MSQIRILIIDDETDICTFFRRLLTKKGYEVTTATNEPEALRALTESRFSVAMVDLKLPDTDGLMLLKEIKARQPACEVIIMTGYSTVKTAVTAMQQGAYEYLEKPFDDIGEIETLISRAVAHGDPQRKAGQVKEEWAEVAAAVGFQVGSSPLMQRLVSLAYKVAGKNITMLIQGKTGTGKEVLARFVHAASTRAEGAFIPINCGALPENLLESELFGHERGAFTGANQTRRGIFELANHGTLLLDEIGDASPMIQVKLLRVLETGEFMRVGGERTIKTDVRVIAATNVNLEEAIREKTFREDLYYRLNVVRLEIPSLHQRSEDVPLLAAHFARQFNPKANLSPGALRLLQSYNWPGNIRELANVMRRAVVMCQDDTILPNHLNDRFQTGAAISANAMTLQEPDATDFLLASERFLERSRSSTVFESLKNPEYDRLLYALHGIEEAVLSDMRQKGMVSAISGGLKESEADTIKRTLNLHHWSITETARSLGIGRNTLYRKIAQFKLAR
ncbi:MAG: AAA family ATPase [Geobacteraceae bacterium GWC2_53_11]|nr:MAG: AAA family ATPase [Geobacteraceae bacterium GWC2_53_11]